MPPDDQSQELTPEPIEPPSTSPANDPPEPEQTSATGDVVEPSLPNPVTTSPETTIEDASPNPEQPATPAVATPMPSTDAPKPALTIDSIKPVTPAAAVAEPTSSLSSASLENEVSKRSKSKFLTILLIVVAIILLVGIGAFYYFYSQNDHSIYSKLSIENYSSAKYNLSFEYPSVMASDPSGLSKLGGNATAGPLLLYGYLPTSSQKIAIVATYFDNSSILQSLGLSGAQAEKQILAKTGSYINTLDKADANAFKTIYPNCNSYIKNINGQTSLICIANNPDGNVGKIGVIVTGITTNSQYSLVLEMPNSIWNAHQKVWQKVEKSFTYQ